MKQQIEITVRCPVHESFRVAQIGGMFDMPIARKAERTFRFEMPPGIEEDWKIGLIVGPSGSGKSTVAEKLYGESVYRRGDWPADKAVVDCFGETPVREITHLLTAVGFSSPPGWIKPYSVLSNGEQFRCDLARALGGKASGFGLQGPEASPPVVFDEYTSVVDRNVAKIASAAIAKGIRSGRIARRFVAVTCHYDVAAWLEPDWILDTATGEAQRGSLRRPRIELDVVRCAHQAWKLFAPHHYLSGSLHHAAQCYMGLWEETPVAFCALLPLYGFKNHWRVSRIVTLPDYQGIGIGSGLIEALGGLYRKAGRRFSLTASHPAVIAYCRKSPLWRTVSVKRTGSGTQCGVQTSAGRAVVSFEMWAAREQGTGE